MPAKVRVAPTSPATAGVAVMAATVPMRGSTAAPVPAAAALLPVVSDQAVRRSTRISRMASTGPWQRAKCAPRK